MKTSRGNAARTRRARRKFETLITEETFSAYFPLGNTYAVDLNGERIPRSALRGWENRGWIKKVDDDGKGLRSYVVT